MDTDELIPSPPEMDGHPFSIILLGLSGLASAFLGVLTHFQEQMEYSLRMGTMAVGLGVSVLSGAVLWRKFRGK